MEYFGESPKGRDGKKERLVAVRFAGHEVESVRCTVGAASRVRHDPRRSVGYVCVFCHGGTDGCGYTVGYRISDIVPVVDGAEGCGLLDVGVDGVVVDVL